MNQPAAQPQQPATLADVLALQLGRMQRVVDELANPKPTLLMPNQNRPDPKQLESMLLAEIHATVAVMAEALIRIERAAAVQQHRETGGD
jgi:hypothetical protein